MPTTVCSMRISDGRSVVCSSHLASAATYNYQQHNVYVGGSCLVVITQWSNNDSGVTAWASSHTSGDPCISLRAAVLANLYGQVVTDTLYTTGSNTGAIGAYGALFASRHRARPETGLCREHELSIDRKST